MFVVNCKNYEEIAGDKIVKFVKTSEKIAKKYKVKIAICPPQPVELAKKEEIDSKK